MSTGDIRKSSRAPAVDVVKQGHTSNGAFGSDPNKNVKGGRPVRELSIPAASK